MKPSEKPYNTLVYTQPYRPLRGPDHKGYNDFIIYNTTLQYIPLSLSFQLVISVRRSTDSSRPSY